MSALIIELKQEGQYWTLYVDGVPRVQDESFAICDQVADQLRRGTTDTSECGEVARSILNSKPVWGTEALQRDFVVIQFAAPYVYVERKSDNQRGTLLFNATPRYYFDFVPDRSEVR